MKLGKQETLELLKEKVGFGSKKEAGEFLDKIDLAIKVVSGELDVDGKVKLGNYIIVEKKRVEEKTGVAFGKEHTTPAHNAIKIKHAKTVKELG